MSRDSSGVGLDLKSMDFTPRSGGGSRFPHGALGLSSKMR